MIFIDIKSKKTFQYLVKDSSYNLLYLHIVYSKYRGSYKFVPPYNSLKIMKKHIIFAYSYFAVFPHSLKMESLLRSKSFQSLKNYFIYTPRMKFT